MMTKAEFYIILHDCYNDKKRIQFINELNLNTYYDFVSFLYKLEEHSELQNLFLPENNIFDIDLLNKEISTESLIIKGTNGYSQITVPYSLNDMQIKLQSLKINNEKFELSIFMSNSEKTTKNRL